MEHRSAERVDPPVGAYRALRRALGIRSPRRALRRLLLVGAQAALIVLALYALIVLTWPDMPM